MIPAPDEFDDLDLAFIQLYLVRMYPLPITISHGITVER